MHRIAAIAFAGITITTVAPPAYATEPIPILRGTLFDQRDTDVAFELSNNLEKRLTGLIYVDWIVDDMAIGDEVPITTESCHAAGDSGTVHVDLDTFSFSPYRNFRTVITVTAGDPEHFPLNLIECQQDLLDPMIYTVRIRGVYFAVKTTIPTANAYDLRPVEPTIEMIQQLQASGAFGD